VILIEKAKEGGSESMQRRCVIASINVPLVLKNHDKNPLDPVPWLPATIRASGVPSLLDRPSILHAKIHVG